MSWWNLYYAHYTTLYFVKIYALTYIIFIYFSSIMANQVALFVLVWGMISKWFNFLFSYYSFYFLYFIYKVWFLFFIAGVSSQAGGKSLSTDNIWFLFKLSLCYLSNHSSLHKKSLRCCAKFKVVWNVDI